jgi:hypothetical protein
MDRATLAKSAEATYAMLGSKNKTQRLIEVQNIMMGSGFQPVDGLSNRDILYLKTMIKKQS